jgi:hypothetical protein
LIISLAYATWSANLTKPRIYQLSDKQAILQTQPAEH